MPLSEDAKRELHDAIKIVREDRFEIYARDVLGTHATASKKPPEADVDAPPAKDDADKGKDRPKRSKSGWWAEMYDDDEEDS